MGFDGSGSHGFALPRRREAAASHFHKLGEARFASPAAPPEAAAPEACTAAPCRFEIYRADEVRVTATRFSGGDWHWRLSGAGGRPLLDAGGYRTEGECLEAVLLLKSEAALATVSGCA